MSGLPPDLGVCSLPTVAEPGERAAYLSPTLGLAVRILDDVVKGMHLRSQPLLQQPSLLAQLPRFDHRSIDNLVALRHGTAPNPRYTASETAMPGQL